MMLGALMFCAGWPAQALTTLPLTLTQQATKAQVIVRATLGQPTDLKDGDVTYLAYPLNVTETISGDPATLPQVGGKPALVLLSGTQDIPKPAPSQEAILLLYTGMMDSPLVGYNQGYYPISGGKVVAWGMTAVSTGSAPAAPTSAALPATPASAISGAASSSPVTTTPTGTLAAGTPAVAAPTNPLPADPIPTDPAPTDPDKLRDAIRAARGGK